MHLELIIFFFVWNWDKVLLSGGGWLSKGLGHGFGPFKGWVSRWVIKYWVQFQKGYRVQSRLRCKLRMDLQDLVWVHLRGVLSSFIFTWRRRSARIFRSSFSEGCLFFFVPSSGRALFCCGGGVSTDVVARHSIGWATTISLELSLYVTGAYGRHVMGKI